MPPNGIVFYSQSDTIRQQAVGEDTDALTFGVVPWGHNHEIHRSSSSHIQIWGIIYQARHDAMNYCVEKVDNLK